MEQKKPEEIKTHPTFESLFPIKPKVQANIEQDMVEGRYDVSQPIILATWEGQKEPVCIDGHTRLQAAINAGIAEVPVWLHELETEQDALESAIKLQSNRRNMTDAELVTCMEVLDRKRARGGDRRSEAEKSKASGDAIEKPPAKSSKQTGDLLGISQSKVERARTVMEHADEVTKEAVKQGDLSINQAYQKTQKDRKRTTAKDKKTKAREPVSEEVQGVQQASDDNKESTAIRPVFLSLKHFAALRDLGGSIEEHVANAIDLYLESRRPEYRGFPVEASEELGYVDGTEPEEDDDEYWLFA